MKILFSQDFTNDTSINISSTIQEEKRRKETLAQLFSYEFCEISRNTFFIEHLWATRTPLVTASIVFRRHHYPKLNISNQKYFQNKNENSFFSGLH